MALSMVAKGLSVSTSLQSICCYGNPSMLRAPTMAAFSAINFAGVSCSAALQEGGELHSGGDSNNSRGSLGRREAMLSGMAMVVSGGMSVLTPPAFADFDEDYKNETQAVIERVKSTLALEKTDPSKADAVADLRQTSNDWVAKYRREKSVAGRLSFSNMYSVLNAISGHYISFGPNYPIPVKRKDRILEEISDAEKALKRGR